MKLIAVILLLASSLAQAATDEAFSPFVPDEYERIVVFQDGRAENTRYALFKNGKIRFAIDATHPLGRPEGYDIGYVWHVARAERDYHDTFYRRFRGRLGHGTLDGLVGAVIGFDADVFAFWTNHISPIIPAQLFNTTTGGAVVGGCTVVAATIGAIKGSRKLPCSQAVLENLINYPRRELEVRRRGLRARIEDLVRILDKFCEHTLDPAPELVSDSDVHDEPMTPAEVPDEPSL